MTEALGLPQDPGEFPERSGSPVLLVPYDDRWPDLFERERLAIAGALAAHVRQIEHVGSTAVPGLASKPVLDIAVSIDDLANASACIEPLAMLGYVYVPEFEVELPNRRYFRKDARPGHRTHHIHMYAEGHSEFDEFLVFRELLRSDDRTRIAYEKLKFELARTCGRAAYTKAKAPFIRSVLDKARPA